MVSVNYLSALSLKISAILKRIFSALALLLSAWSASAQKHHEIGLVAGVSNYYGDLEQRWLPKRNYHPVAGISYKYFVTPRIGLRAGVSYTKLSAADSLSDVPVYRGRNLSFSTNLLELSGGVEINFLPITRERFKITPYIFGGIAGFYFNPYAYDRNGDQVYLKPLSTEGQGLDRYPDRKPYSLFNVAFPVGGGMKFFVGKTLMITTEVGFRYCATDYLDDVSQSYVSLDTLRAYRGQQSADFSFRGDEISSFAPNGGAIYPDYKYQRGNPKANDWYWFGTLGVSIYLDAFGNRQSYEPTKCR
ncbi:MAG: hypothetical protein EOP52_09105 [Sphingobacteriales bacterium]|nr:MAG: hypothetical protein EOP52_09105 [Sphingobacteriales bacterium]